MISMSKCSIHNLYVFICVAAAQADPLNYDTVSLFELLALYESILGLDSDVGINAGNAEVRSRYG